MTPNGKRPNDTSYNELRKGEEHVRIRWIHSENWTVQFTAKHWLAGGVVRIVLPQAPLRVPLKIPLLYARGCLQSLLKVAAPPAAASPSSSSSCCCFCFPTMTKAAKTQQQRHNIIFSQMYVPSSPVRQAGSISNRHHHQFVCRHQLPPVRVIHPDCIVSGASTDREQQF